MFMAYLCLFSLLAPGASQSRAHDPKVLTLSGPTDWEQEHQTCMTGTLGRVWETWDVNKVYTLPTSIQS